MFHYVSDIKIKIAWKIILVFLATALLFFGCAGEHKKTYRVGILAGLDALFKTVGGFKAEMAMLGYTEGENIVYRLRRTNFDPAAEEHILKEFVADKVDLILVFPSEPAAIAKEVTRGTGIPVVFCQTNIEGTNLIKSVKEPGGNITGVRYPGPDLAVKRFEILHELAPGAKRIWVPYAMVSPIVEPQLQVLRPVAAAAGVTLVEAPVETADELLEDLKSRETASGTDIDAILFISEPLAKKAAVFPFLGKFAGKHNIPIGGAMTIQGEYSTVFGVSTDSEAVGKLAARQVHKVLEGIPAGTVPVISAESYFKINYTAAKKLGLNVTEGLLKLADEIIR